MRISLLFIFVLLLVYSCEKEEPDPSKGELNFPELLDLMGADVELVRENIVGKIISDNTIPDSSFTNPGTTFIESSLKPTNIEGDINLTISYTIRSGKLEHIRFRGLEEFDQLNLCKKISLLAEKDLMDEIAISSLYFKGEGHNGIDFDSSIELWNYVKAKESSLEVVLVKQFWLVDYYRVDLQYIGDSDDFFDSNVFVGDIHSSFL